jgi:hypothetical protein
MTPVCSSATDVTSDFRGSWLSTRTQIALAACACGGATAFLYAVDPNRHAVYPQCLLYNALLHGRVIEALHDNALFVAALPLLLYVAGSYALAAWSANAWPQIPVDGRKLMWRGLAIFFLMIAFMILRNLPGQPFEWLKPLR